MKRINYHQASEEISAWMKRTVIEAGFTSVVVAVSGGVDSATSLFLACKALGIDNVYGLCLPYGKLSTQSLQHGKMVAKAAGLAKDHILVKDIRKAVDKIQSSVINSPLDKIRLGNIMARVRMIFLYDLAKSHNLLVVGTENRTEHYLGYYTRFGDEASDIEPIRNLYKTQVWEMATYLGVPDEIIQKAPSANLWEGQVDEGEFGFSYQDADRILYHYFDEHLPIDGIVALGFEKKLVEKVLAFVAKNDFKHKLPYTLRK